MPLYKYSCTCGASFERLATPLTRDRQVCPSCKGEASRSASSGFAVKSTLDPKDKVVQTSKEIDVVVGRDAERRWGSYEDRRKARRDGMVEISSDVTSGGNVNPGAVLGNSSRKAVARVHSEAVKRGDPSITSSWLDKVDLSSKNKGIRRIDTK